MSLFHYIASNKELPLGEFGAIRDKNNLNNNEKPAIRFANMPRPENSIPLEEIIDLSFIKEGQIKVYQSFEDAAGIFVRDINNLQEDIRKHFKNRYVYQISANWGGFCIEKSNTFINDMDKEMHKACIKCVRELFKYIKENLVADEGIEFYTCWADEEDHERDKSLDKVISLSNYNFDTPFKLEDKEYIIFKL